MEAVRESGAAPISIRASRDRDQVTVGAHHLESSSRLASRARRSPLRDQMCCGIQVEAVTIRRPAGAQILTHRVSQPQVGNTVRSINTFAWETSILSPCRQK